MILPISILAIIGGVIGLFFVLRPPQADLTPVSKAYLDNQARKMGLQGDDRAIR